jgi:hypothetical protein
MRLGECQGPESSQYALEAPGWTLVDKSTASKPTRTLAIRTFESDVSSLGCSKKRRVYNFDVSQTPNPGDDDWTCPFAAVTRQAHQRYIAPCPVPFHALNPMTFAGHAF